MADHKEAFCLMWYACACGHRERIWNSRDGVTPFAMTCPSCGNPTCQHIAFARDEPAPQHRLATGQKFWRDGTADEAEAIMRRRLASAKGTRWEPTPERAEQIIAAVRTDTEGEFQKGWPMLDIEPSIIPARSSPG